MGRPSELNGREVLGAGLATAALGVLQIAIAISVAAMIFTGPLSAGAGRASAGFILGAAIVSITLGLRSSMSTVVGGAQDTGAIVAAAVASSIAASTTPEQSVPTTMVMLAIAALLTGAVMWLVARYRLSSIVRFMPDPVISGFMAGTGWLLLRGGVEIMYRSHIELGDLTSLFEWANFKFLALGLALGLFMLGCAVRNVNGVAVSAAILLTTIGFLVVARSRSSLDAIKQDGWLVGPFPEGSGWAPIGPTDLSNTNWGAIGSNTLPILAIVAVSVVGLMLNLGGLESVLESEIDVDHEVSINGAANVAIGLTGGAVGYHLLGDTILAHQLGVRSRVVPIAIGGLGFAMFLFGYDMIALIPRAVAGGVLVGLGLSLLVSWASALVRQINATDAVISALILAVIAVVGILTGVAVGLLVATGIFVVRYSRIDPVRHIIDAAGRSNVDRPAADKFTLERHKGAITAVEVQGYLFFGSITALRTAVTERFDSTTNPESATFVIIDMRHVSGIDSTAASSLVALESRVANDRKRVVWSGLRPALRSELEANGIDVSDAHDDLDHAIAWCEDQILAGSKPTARVQSNGSAPMNYPGCVHRHVDTRTLVAGDTLIAVADKDQDLYFVREGTFTAWTKLDDGQQKRLRQIAAGAVIGEVAFCTGAPRTATVIADTEAVVDVLSRERFDQMRDQDPEAAIELQSYLLARLSNRLSSTSAMVRDLMR